VAAITAWFVGDSVRVRRVYVAGLAEQAAQRQREAVERAQRSVAEERLQIARELHDVVAHSLSVIAVQSGWVVTSSTNNRPRRRRRWRPWRRPADPLSTNCAGCSGSCDETRVLPASLAPAPDVGSLGPLIEQVQMAGYVVDLDVRSLAVRSLAPTVGLSLYRIIQEALTNVVKHAGPASVRVEIRDEADALVLEVNDNGRGVVRLPPGRTGAHDQETHHGIVGMRERVALYHGALSVGPGPEGGFRVLARFPFEGLVASS
jgi:signal transduction histidine kinase